MTIRRMIHDDEIAVSRMLSDCYRWLGERGGYTADQTEFLVATRGSVACVARESLTQLYLVACTGEDVCGLVSISGNEITKLFVAPGHHRKRIGTQLFMAAEEAIRTAGYERLTLGAFPTAVAFYRAMGLSVIGQKPCGPSALAGLSMTLMEKRLREAGT